VTIAGTGSSGHFVGAILLAYLLGPYLGLISMSAILTVQCLFFADGGIIALGANILNMGVIPCLIIFPLITKLFKKSGNKVERDAFSLAFASYLSVIAGSIMVAVETLPLAGLSFAEFALQMLSIHALIGLIEIVLTITIAGIFTAIELSPLNYNKRIIVTLSSAAFLAFISAGILSLFASSFPDGLEWSVMRVTDTIATAPVDEFFALHALFPDYALRSSELLIGTSISGIIGAFFVWAFMTLPRLPIYKRIKSNT
jgi:cobalt/nickel transport system permease protein